MNVRRRQKAAARRLSVARQNVIQSAMHSALRSRVAASRSVTRLSVQHATRQLSAQRRQVASRSAVSRSVQIKRAAARRNARRNARSSVLTRNNPFRTGIIRDTARCGGISFFCKFASAIKGFRMCGV
jgi:hypothetical protein